MATVTPSHLVSSPIHRLFLGGALAAVIAAVPMAVAAGSDQGDPSVPLATCPAGEVLDTASGACKPQTDQAPPTMNPIDPEKVPFQPGSMTSSRPGDVGSLPEVNGIPCNSNNHGGGSTGECIGLSENNGTFHQPKTSVDGQSVAPPPA